MCLILWALARHPRYRLILAANRDEFHARPTLPAAFWPDRPGVLGGRDLVAGGTWLAVHRNGRMAAITNYRDPAAANLEARSRGQLVAAFVSGQQPPEDFLVAVNRCRSEYNGFNLLLAEGGRMWYCGSRQGKVSCLTPGIYGLSNHLLDTPWPKVVVGKADLARCITAREPAPEGLRALMVDRRQPPDGLLPDTGVGLEWERILAPRFIVGPGYGTRSCTVLLVTHAGRMTFCEWTFAPGADPPIVQGKRCFAMTMEK
jgi:uncharacterized protein with NRDE domain